MKVTYIAHSGFALELEDKTLLFDYYKGDLSFLNREKPLYVFVSHRHGDHFNKKIFELPDLGHDAHYILSDDITFRKSSQYDVHFIAPHTGLTTDGIHIFTLKSNDEGVAFVIETNGQHIYHAGDLNLWRWEGEPEDWNDGMERDYRAELERIRKEHFDVAFLPLDPRQEQYYDWGIKAFMEYCTADALFPMHFGEDNSVISALKSQALPWARHIKDIEKESQIFEV